MSRLQKVDTIVLHHSASDNPAHDDISVIRDWHLARGWNDVGYHYFVKSTGEIQRGREIDINGAHVKGYNSTTIGICLHGMFDFPEIQFKRTGRLITGLLLILGELKIRGHNYFDPVNKPDCPGFDVNEFINNFI